MILMKIIFDWIQNLKNKQKNHYKVVLFIFGNHLQS